MMTTSDSILIRMHNCPRFWSLFLAIELLFLSGCGGADDAHQRTQPTAEPVVVFGIDDLATVRTRFHVRHSRLPWIR